MAAPLVSDNSSISKKDSDSSANCGLVIMSPPSPKQPSIIIVEVEDDDDDDDKDDSSEQQDFKTQNGVNKSQVEIAVVNEPLLPQQHRDPAGGGSDDDNVSQSWRWWSKSPDSVVQQKNNRPVITKASSNGSVASDSHAKTNGGQKKKDTQVAISGSNHQNSYVSVSVSEDRQQQQQDTTTATGLSNGRNTKRKRKSRDASTSASSSSAATVAASSSAWCWCISGRKWRSREKWLLLFLLLVTVACLAFLAISLISMLRQGQEGAQTGDQDVCFSEECVRTAASLLVAMNRSADPCQDFFQFACGAWNKKHVIPEDRSSISTFEVLADQLQLILKGLLEEEANEADNSATTKAKRFYQSCMNTSQIRTTGDQPLRETLQRLGGWPVLDPNWPGAANASDTGNSNINILAGKLESVESLLGRLRGDFNQGVMIEQWVGPDDKDSSVNIIQLDQMQLGLPGRDYYKASSGRDLKAYHRYMTDVAVLLGAERRYASEEMKKVIQFETMLANVSIPEADRQDTGAIYERMSLSELERRVPEILWRDYLNAFLPETPADDSEPIVSYAMSYFQELGHLLARTDRRIVQNYILWRFVMDLIPHLPDEYQEKRAEFRRVLLGVLSERNRWNQCVEWTNKKLGMAVGALFIRDNFNQESKTVALEMIHTLREAFIEILDELEWMDEETRQVARQKALAMNERIGYPDMLTRPTQLEDEYVLLEVTESQFLQNILNVKRYEALYNLHKLRQPVAKDKWSTEPAVVNAFYNPNKNDIVFPAGILQPLFYSSQFPKSLNYGGIGVVIGHEITHGFDDKGRQFDKEGNLKQWWNNATVEAFRRRTQCIIDQYSSYKLEEVNLNVNGRMTQGENIADNGGLKQAFRAYRKWVSRHGEEPLLPGLEMSHDQLFFLNYAQIWCGSMRPEDALTKIRSSVHSPGPIRVLGPLSNSPEFAAAYKCPVGSRMNPRRKCSVW